MPTIHSVPESYIFLQYTKCIKTSSRGRILLYPFRCLRAVQVIQMVSSIQCTCRGGRRPVFPRPITRLPSADRSFSLGRVPVYFLPTTPFVSAECPFTFGRPVLLSRPSARLPSVDRSFSFGRVPVYLRPTGPSVSAECSSIFGRVLVYLRMGACLFSRFPFGGSNSNGPIASFEPILRTHAVSTQCAVL